MNAPEPAQRSTPLPSDSPVMGHRFAGAEPPVVPDYELIRRIGGGSYGEVWLARSTTGVLRAVKIVWRHTFEDERPFKREFEGIQRFEKISREHHSQLALFHIGRNEAAGCFYYVMELADDAAERTKEECRRQNEASAGSSQSASAFSLPPSTFERYAPHTLRADLEQGRLPAARVLEIGLALSEALSHLHSNGLVHRDVKPSNVIFVNGRPKLADIGLVTDASDQCSIVGTEGYLPPEGPGTPQADIFALGKVLYEALTGLDRRSFPKLSEDLRDWPDAAQVFELNEIILKACEGEPPQRYASAAALREDLALLQRGQSVKRQRSLKKLWAASLKVGIALVLLAIITAVLIIVPRQLTPSDISTYGPPSTNMYANMHCDKGLSIIREDNIADFPKAYTNFYQAIELDPRFARPYAGLLDLRLRHSAPGISPSTTEEMRKIAAKLKDLAPRSAATALAQSVISFYDWDFPSARRYGQQAIKASPGYELGHIWYGFMLMNWGWFNEAHAQADISQKLAPSKATSYRLHGNTYYAQRDFTNAITWYGQSVALDRYEPGGKFIGNAFRAMGDYTNAIAKFETRALLFTTNESETRQRYDTLRQAFNEGGARGYWQEEWKRTENKPNEDFYWKAVIQIHRGDTNAALDWLAKSFKTHEHSGFESALSSLLWDESWDGLRENTGFMKLLDDVGFTKVMPPRKK